jgi:hypothetical protein
VTLRVWIAAALAAGALVPAAAASWSAGRSEALPRSCPPAAVLRAALRQRVTHVSSYVGPISSTTLAGMGPAPDSAHYKKTSQRERTCTYSGSLNGPVTISFIAPITAQAFGRAKASLRKSGVPVTTVGGIGDTAWAAKGGGLLFVLRGELDLVISAPRTTVADLRALAGQIV